MGCTGTLHIQELSYDVASNTSRVQIWIDYAQTGETWSGYTKSGWCWISVNGGGETAYGISTTLPKGSAIRGFDTTITVTHNADGTGSVSARSELYTGLSVGTVTASGSLTLTTIPRATTPTLSASTVEMGKSITVNLPRASSAFTHNVTYSFGSASGTISSNAGTSCTFAPPTTLASQVPKATSGVGTITVQTKNGNTVIGTKSISFTATVPASIVPSVSAVSTSDPTGYYTKYGAYIQNKSTVKVAVTASGNSGSTISSYSISANGSTYTANNSTTGVLKTVGTNTITAKVTDTRGRTASKSTTISVIAYSNPTISKLSAIRCDASGVADDNGEYALVTMNASVTALNNKNSRTFKLEYKESTSSTWTTAETYTSAYVLNTTKVISCDTEKMYDFRLSVTDDFATTTSLANVSTAFVLMDFNAEGKGIGIGQVSRADYLDVNLVSKFHKRIETEYGVASSTYGLENQTIPTLFDIVSTRWGLQSGSFNLQADYTANNNTIPAQWYHYIYIPHRTGGPSGDNYNYGNLLLFPLNKNYSSFYLVNKNSTYIRVFTFGNITDNDSRYVRQSNVAMATGNFPSAASGQVSITIPSGFTIANSCPISPVQYQNANGNWYSCTAQQAMCFYVGRVNYITPSSDLNGRPIRVLFYRHS